MLSIRQIEGLLKPVSSSNIESIGFEKINAGFSNVYIKFKRNKDIYIYRNVKYEDYYALIHADSVGKQLPHFAAKYLGVKI